MGVRSFLKSKVKDVISKSGPAAAPKKAATSSPAPSAEAIMAAMENLPKEPDADGFIAVAPSSILREGEGNTFKAGDIPVAAFRKNGKVYVIDDECAHENGPLGEGSLSDFVVTCPYHDWRYDVRTGDNLTDPERHIACFKVKEEGGYIWVGSKLRDGSALRGGLHDDGLNLSETR